MSKCKHKKFFAFHLETCIITCCLKCNVIDYIELYLGWWVPYTPLTVTKFGQPGKHKYYCDKSNCYRCAFYRWENCGVSNRVAVVPHKNY